MITAKFREYLFRIEEAYKRKMISRPDEEDAIIKYLFAKYFGWTPEQVGKISYRDVQILKKLMEVDAKEQEIMMSKYERRLFMV